MEVFKKNDIITGPFPENESECTYGDLQSAYDQMERYAVDLKEAVSRLKSSKFDLQQAYIDTIRRLAMAVEYKDEETGGHVQRIGKYSVILGRHLGLSYKRLHLLYHAAPLHDVGKIGIPDSILLKPGKLDSTEFTIMKEHTVIGGKLLCDSKSEIIETAYHIALSHHERWDGTGYPYGLAGKNIPLEGRITAVADVFDALRSKRPYKEAFPREQVTEIMRSQNGKHFDPEIADILLNDMDTFYRVAEDWSDSEEEFFRIYVPGSVQENGIPYLAP